MFVAIDEELTNIFTGTEIQSHIIDTGRSIMRRNFSCPICGEEVRYSQATVERPFDYFTHASGKSDCFNANSMSYEHRLGVEITVKSLHNRVREVSGEPVEVDIEKWIGRRSNFVIADVRITEPLQIAAEVFYRSGDLELCRRLDTLFENDYRAYLIFHSDGLHNVDQVERHLQQITSLRVGRFNRKSLELTLGSLFDKEQMEVDASTRDQLPKYIR